MDYNLGFFDKYFNRVEPVGENPFNQEVLPMSPVWTICFPGDHKNMAGAFCLIIDLLISLKYSEYFE